MTTASKPVERAQHVLGQHDGADGRAGHERILSGRQFADVHHMKAVDVLCGRNSGQHLHGIDVLRQRQLNENAVNGGIIVELLDNRQNIGLGCFGRQLVLPRIHADFDRLLRLVGHIDLGGRVFAHQNDGEARESARDLP
jgi:hypothetical protein